MYYHLNIENQIKKIMSKFNEYELETADSSDEPVDIIHGQIYKQLLESEDGVLFKHKKAISLIMNSDGISSFKKSKLTIWPVWININELPLSKRFSIDNTILAGLSIGEEKPNTDHFFNPIVIQLKKLELGFDLSIQNVTRETKCFLIAAIFDKPAKAAILNINGCNGFYGCHGCYQKGCSYSETKEKNNQRNEPVQISATNKSNRKTIVFKLNLAQFLQFYAFTECINC
jgi:hypothetical protein